MSSQQFSPVKDKNEGGKNVSIFADAAFENVGKSMSIALDAKNKNIAVERLVVKENDRNSSTMDGRGGFGRLMQGSYDGRGGEGGRRVYDDRRRSRGCDNNNKKGRGTATR